MIGYLTGYSVFNQLGLTTQVSNIIQIGKNEVRPIFNRSSFKISIIRQKNTITKENIPLLQILDSIKLIKKIPDSSIDYAIKRIKILIKDLPENNISKMVKLSIKYPPSTRALLGAILEEIGFEVSSEKLYFSLNPITKYTFPKANKELSNTEKWNIK